jgi:hypothetical protein
MIIIQLGCMTVKISHLFFLFFFTSVDLMIDFHCHSHIIKLYDKIILAH